MNCAVCGAELKVYDIEVREVEIPTDGQGNIEYSWSVRPIGEACGEAVPEDIHASAEAARLVVAEVVGNGYVACDCEVCPYKVEEGRIVTDSSMIGDTTNQTVVNTHRL